MQRFLVKERHKQTVITLQTILVSLPTVNHQSHTASRLWVWRRAGSSEFSTTVGFMPNSPDCCLLSDTGTETKEQCVQSGDSGISLQKWKKVKTIIDSNQRKRREEKTWHFIWRTAPRTVALRQCIPTLFFNLGTSPRMHYQTKISWSIRYEI